MQDERCAGYRRPSRCTYPLIATGDEYLDLGATRIDSAWLIGRAHPWLIPRQHVFEEFCDQLIEVEHRSRPEVKSADFQCGMTYGCSVPGSHDELLRTPRAARCLKIIVCSCRLSVPPAGHVQRGNIECGYLLGQVERPPEGLAAIQMLEPLAPCYI